MHGIYGINLVDNPSYLGKLLSFIPGPVSIIPVFDAACSFVNFTSLREEALFSVLYVKRMRNIFSLSNEHF